MRIAHPLRAPGRGARRADSACLPWNPALRPRSGYVLTAALAGLFVAAASAMADDCGESDFNANLAAQAQAASDINAELHVDVLEEGVSSRRLRRDCGSELPLDRLTPEGRRLAESVLNDLSLHRRLPVVRCETDPRVVQYFFQYPDVAVAIWRAMDISDMQLSQIGPQRYRSDSGDGSVGTMSVLLSDGRMQLVYCEGQFKSPLLARAIHASALMWVQAEFQRDSQGRDFAKCTAEVFVAFPSNTIETAARVISPVSNRIADRNFHEVAMFVRMMHLGMTRQPGWIEHLASQLPGVAPERSQALLDVSAKVYVDAQRKLAQAEGQQSLTPEALRLPMRREPEVKAASGGSETGTRQTAATPNEAAPR